MQQPIEFSDSDSLTKLTIKTGNGSKLHYRTQLNQNSCAKSYRGKSDVRYPITDLPAVVGLSPCFVPVPYYLRPCCSWPLSMLCTCTLLLTSLL
jgi:hypothetical protein